MQKQVSATNQTQLSAPAAKFPIVLVPGIMGTRLMDSSGRLVWNPAGKPINFDVPFFQIEFFDPGLVAYDGERLADMQPLLPAWPTQDQFRGMPWSQIHRNAPIRRFYSAIASCYAELLYALQEDLPVLLAARGSTLMPQVYVGGYDWRQSNDDSANNHLAPVVAQALEETGAEKVVLIGHSLGGQVSRYYARKNPSKVAAFIALASPHIGAVQPYTRLKQGVVYNRNERHYDDIVTKFMTHFLGVGDPWACAQLLRKFPSMYQLMANKHYFAAMDWLTYEESLAGYPYTPEEGEKRPGPKGYDIYYDLFAGLTEHAGLRQEAIALLDIACGFHEVLTENGKIFQPENSYCAYSATLETQVAAHVPDYGKLHEGTESIEYLGAARIDVTIEASGDSAVPLISGWPQNVSRAFVDSKQVAGAVHGGFSNHEDVIPIALGWLTDFLTKLPR